MQNVREALCNYSLNLLSQNDHVVYSIKLRETHHCFCSVQVIKYLEAIAMWHNILHSREK